MGSRFNAPPNWPVPSTPGWMPPPGWEPDPSWGPAPYGWNLWVEDPFFGGQTSAVGSVAPATVARRNRFLRHPVITIITAVVVAVIAAGSIAVGVTTVMKVSAKGNELKGQFQGVSQGLAAPVPTPTGATVDLDYHDPRQLAEAVTTEEKELYKKLHLNGPQPVKAVCVPLPAVQFSCSITYSDGSVDSPPRIEWVSPDGKCFSLAPGSCG